MAAYLENRSLVTDQVVIPGGRRMCDTVVRTSYDGYRRLSPFLGAGVSTGLNKKNGAGRYPEGPARKMLY